MRLKIKYFVIFFFSLNILHSQIVKLKPNNDYQEVWHKKIPISGGLKVGAMYSVSETNKVQKTFFIKLPDGIYNHKLCVQVNSIDGRFYASMSYNIIIEKGGLIELEWPTKYWNELQSYSTDKIAILGTLSKGCNTEKEIIVPSSWNQSDMIQVITIFVNSDKFPKVEVFNKKTKKTKEYVCTVLKGNEKVAYKCLCEIPISEIPENYEMNILHRVRSGASTNYKSFPVVLKL